MNTLPPSIERILERARPKHYPRGQIILYAGDNLSEVYIIKSGVVRIYDIDEDGNEKVLHLVKEPAVIPYAFFSGDHTTTKWYYSALVDCDLYVFERQVLYSAMRDDSELALELIGNFSRDVHEQLVRLSSLGKSKTYDKLFVALRYLLVCHATERPSSWSRVNFAVNHQLLADMIGVTRESVAVAMKEMQEEGLIRNPRQTILEINGEMLMERSGK